MICSKKNSCAVWGGCSSGNPGKFHNFYPHLSLQTLFPALTMPQNCYIVTTGSLTQHIYPAWKTILTIWQNMKAREKIPITQLLSEPGKTLKYSKIPIFNLYELRKTRKYSPCQKSHFWIYRLSGKSYVLI